MNGLSKPLSLLYAVMLTLTFGIASCAKSGKPSSPDAFVPFDSFLTETRSARFEDYRGNAAAQVESAAAFAEMKAHLLQLYDGVHPTNTFMDRNRLVDCVPLEQQPGLRRPGATRETVQKPPDLKEAASPQLQKPESDATGRQTESVDITLKAGVRDPFGHEKYCGEGSFPMQRLTLTELTRFKNLRSFFRKGSLGDNFELHPNPSPPRPIPGDDSTHYYARGVQYVDNFGADAWLDLWSPTVADTHMSLSQLWIVGGDGDTKQTAEAGWQVYSGDGTDARLFIYYTTKGYTDGCYNTACSGFVQVANNVYLGSGFDHYSSVGGAQWGFNLQWKRHTDGNWWLFYRGPGNYIPVGYYPKSLYGRGALADKATKIAFGGEDTGSAAAKQMGSGEKADGGWQHAAYQHTIFYIDTNTTSQWASLAEYESHPDCYTADLHNLYGSWGTYLYFGGPKCP